MLFVFEKCITINCANNIPDSDYHLLYLSASLSLQFDVVRYRLRVSVFYIMVLNLVHLFVHSDSSLSFNYVDAKS